MNLGGTLALSAVLVLTGCGLQDPPPVSDKVAEYYSNPPTPMLQGAVKMPAIPAGSQVLIIGDSYAEGSGATNRGTGRYAVLLSQTFGWASTIDGVGGTGFTWGGGTDGSANKQYINRIAAHAGMKPALVILQGGQNDHRASKEELASATTKTVAAVQASWPDAVVLVIGPTAPQPLAAKLGTLATSIHNGAVEAKAFSINPIREKWFTTENSPGFDFDTAHVNDAGHQYMADRIVADIKALQGA